ncbi:MAG: hypothetical protein K2N73_11030 [Lachnospiraceae bacterium]|nr:hypothetical protein [Lachnospiraceae bacterium]
MENTNEKLSKAVLTVDYRNGTGKGSFQKKQGQADREQKIAMDTFRQLHQNEAGFQEKNSNVDIKADRENEAIKKGIIRVQYNPASIKYRVGTSENTDVKNDMEVGENVQITTITSESTIDMSFSLVFHRRSPMDQSVRDQMELIMDMICNSPTKRVDFSWSDIHMEGKLVSFSGEYDMFDSTGNPISGHMDLTIEASAKAEGTSKILSQLEDRHRDRRKEQKQEACAGA